VTNDDETADTRILQELRRIAARVDPVPAELLAAARGSLDWRTVDAELARLTFDSVVDAGDGQPVRGGGRPRLLTFAAEGLEVEVELLPSGPRWRLVGQLVPPGPAEVEVRYLGGTVDASADQLGRFVVDGVPSGPVSLCCRTAGRTVVTDWLTI
jgi:hypothetical protein